MVSIVGCGGRIPAYERPKAEHTEAVEKYTEMTNASVNVGSAGTAARFLTAYLGLSKGRYFMDSSDQMKKRPMEELLKALEDLGASIAFTEEMYHFPFIIGNDKVRKHEVTIDADYRGEVGVILVNLSGEAQTIEPGERICQMVIAKHETPEIVEVSELSDTERGAGGFGHSGRK